MWSLFDEPTNNLERLILNNNMWEWRVISSNAHLKKHDAAGATMHQFTDINTPEVWSPVFTDTVLDDL